MTVADYRFKIVGFENYDGDSFDLTLDLGFDLILHRKCRINGVDTPELRGGTDEQKAAGRLARDKARLFVAEAMVDGGAEFVSQNYSGKFGRPLGDIVRQSDGVGLVSYLIGSNYGVPYFGQAKSKVAGAHAANLAALKEAGEI